MARGKVRDVSLALVQFAPRKGDVDANIRHVAEAFAAMREDRAGLPDVAVFPEASLSGYFVEGGVGDVALTAQDAVSKINAALRKSLGARMPAVDAVIGFYEDDEGKFYNSALYATFGPKPELRHVHRKLFLPTYGVFDEERFVSRGRTITAFDTPHGRAAILICEDACHSLSTVIAALSGANTIYIPSASPGRGMEDAEPANITMWRELMRVVAAEHGIFVAYAGLVGFEGGKGLSGASRLVGPQGDVRAEAPFLGETILRSTIAPDDVRVARSALPMLGDLEANLAEFSVMLDAEVSRRPRARGSAR